jgi:hypothetical protein
MAPALPPAGAGTPPRDRVGRYRSPANAHRFTPPSRRRPVGGSHPVTPEDKTCRNMVIAGQRPEPGMRLRESRRGHQPGDAPRARARPAESPPSGTVLGSAGERRHRHAVRWSRAVPGMMGAGKVNAAFLGRLFTPVRPEPFGHWRGGVCHRRRARSGSGASRGGAPPGCQGVGVGGRRVSPLGSLLSAWVEKSLGTGEGNVDDASRTWLRQGGRGVAPRAAGRVTPSVYPLCRSGGRSCHRPGVWCRGGRARVSPPSSMVAAWVERVAQAGDGNADASSRFWLRQGRGGLGLRAAGRVTPNVYVLCQRGGKAVSPPWSKVKAA